MYYFILVALLVVCCPLSAANPESIPTSVTTYDPNTRMTTTLSGFRTTGLSGVCKTDKPCRYSLYWTPAAGTGIDSIGMAWASELLATATSGYTGDLVEANSGKTYVRPIPSSVPSDVTTMFVCIFVESSYPTVGQGRCADTGGVIVTPPTTCTVSNADVSFGTIGQSELTGNVIRETSITVNCSSAAAVTISSPDFDGNGHKFLTVGAQNIRLEALLTPPQGSSAPLTPTGVSFDVSSGTTSVNLRTSLHNNSGTPSSGSINDNSVLKIEYN